MSQIIEATVPDIGDYHDIPVIDLCVAVGDTVKVDDALVTLESDKATMDVPSSIAGVVREVKVKLGDKVSIKSPTLTSYFFFLFIMNSC
jgi:pyruvate/2-oxoglutarate dehydrogenase complex dihydrolipoamide acyltransferase (E2) component